MTNEIATVERPKPLHLINGLDEYLANYGKYLGKKAIHSLDPLHVPGRDPLPDFSDIIEYAPNREPFPCQANVIAASVKMMDEKGSGFIVGEMGTGKTLLGIVAADRHARRSRNEGGYGGNYRAVVLCPDHLIGKWEREIKETLPEVTVTRFGPRTAWDDTNENKGRRKAKKGHKPEGSTRQSLRDTLRLLDKSQGGRWEKPKGAEWYLLGRNQAKWLSDWAGMADREKCVSEKTVIVDRVTMVDEKGMPQYDSRGNPIKKPVFGKVYTCPSCGRVALDKKGVPLAKKDLSADGKNASQKRCQGLYMVAKFDHEKPNLGPDRMRLPRRYSEGAEPGKEVNHAGRKWEIRKCGEPLYTYTSRPYRWSPARIFQKQLKRFFTYLIIDEVHEHKSDESGQSMACSKLMAGANHILALTGTLIGGYADHLFPLLMRICPKSLIDEGFEWGKDLPFSEAYGRIDRVVTIKEDDDGPSVRGKTQSMRRAKSGKAAEKKYVRPGIMPGLFGSHLIGSSIFITLEELAEDLPDLYEYIGGPLPEPSANMDEDETDRWEAMKLGWNETAIDMNHEQLAEYDRITAIMEEANKELLVRGSTKFLGAMLWTLLDYPDRPFGWDMDKETRKAYQAKLAELTEQGIQAEELPKAPHPVGYWDKPGIRTIDNWVGVLTPADLSRDVVYPKEQALVDICLKQKAEGRQTWVYVQMTSKRNVQPRLKQILEKVGLKVGILRSDTVEPRDREEWITRHGREYDVMLSHPQLVSTGLDLFVKAQGGHNYATIVFYETGYNPFTMRQAARRAWRIGQMLDCRIYYLYYKATMQHRAMNLMSKKFAASQALEGDLNADGLAAMAGDESIQMAMAKTLSERIEDSDVLRSWSKVKSGPKKKARNALADAGKAISPSPLDVLPIEVQLVAETILEGQKREPNPEAEADYAAVADRIAATEPDEVVAATGPLGGDGASLALVGDEGEEEPAKRKRRAKRTVTGAVPELTEDILAKMFANMSINGL